MSARYFVHNLETDKLNIFTGGKSDWLTLPESDRNSIKSACLWSRSINGWVSRGKSASWNVMHLRDSLAKLGFEDRGTEGERLSFADQIEAKQERAEARAERFEDRADTANATGSALYKHAHTMAQAIPFGQPILVGHHSEKRDRNFRDRIHNTFGRAFSELDKAKHYEQRAAIARNTADGAQYSNPAYLERRIKENKAELAILNLRLQGKAYTYSEAKPISDEYRERLNGLIEQETEKLEFHEHCMATCGKTLYSRETLKGMSHVKIRGRWEEIVRLNLTTVAVPNSCFPQPEHQRKWALKYGYGEVQDARKAVAA